MAVGEFRLHQTVLRLAHSLDAVRAICDRAHEEHLFALVDSRELAAHYAYALGTVMHLAQQEIEELAGLGYRRAEHHEEANAAARAALDAFKRQCAALDGVQS